MTRKVLLAQCNQEYLQSLVTFFNIRGYQVVVARDSNDALRVAVTEDLDLVVIDMDVEGAGGEAVISSIKSQAVPTPVIALAQTHSLDSERHLRSLGADYYLAKPFLLSDLGEVVGNLLKLRDRLKHSAQG